MAGHQPRDAGDFAKATNCTLSCGSSASVSVSCTSCRAVPAADAAGCPEQELHHTPKPTFPGVSCGSLLSPRLRTRPPAVSCRDAGSRCWQRGMSSEVPSLREGCLQPGSRPAHSMEIQQRRSLNGAGSRANPNAAAPAASACCRCCWEIRELLQHAASASVLV